MQPEPEQAHDVTFTLYCDLATGQPKLLEIETDNRNRVITKKVALKEPIDVEGDKCRTGRGHLKKVRDARFHLIIRDTSGSEDAINSWGMSFTPVKDTANSPFGNAAEGGKALAEPKGSYTEYHLKPSNDLIFINPGLWRYVLKLDLAQRGSIEIDPEMEVTL